MEHAQAQTNEIFVTPKINSLSAPDHFTTIYYDVGGNDHSKNWEGCSDVELCVVNGTMPVKHTLEPPSSNLEKV